MGNDKGKHGQNHERQESHERNILQISLEGLKRNEWMQNNIKVKDARNNLAELNRSFEGYNARQKDNRWNQQINQWRHWESKRKKVKLQIR